MRRMTDWTSYTISELRAKAEEYNVALGTDMRKSEIVAAMEAREAEIQTELAATADAEEPDDTPEPDEVEADEPGEVESEQTDEPEQPDAPITRPDALRPTARGRRVPLAGIVRSFDEGRASSAVTALQSELTRNGLYAGRLDGHAGPLTRKAVANAHDVIGADNEEVPSRGLLEALGFDVR